MTSTGDADGTNAAFNFHAGHLSMQIELEKVRSRVQRHVVRRGEDVSRADRCASALCNHSEATFGLGPRVRGREHHEKAHGPASGLPRDARPVTDVTDVDCSSHELVTPPAIKYKLPWAVFRCLSLSFFSTCILTRDIPTWSLSHFSRPADWAAHPSPGACTCCCRDFAPTQGTRIVR